MPLMAETPSHQFRGNVSGKEMVLLQDIVCMNGLFKSIIMNNLDIKIENLRTRTVVNMDGTPI
jgi:hypothetical protein